MPKILTATEARIHFGELLRTVNTIDDHIVIEKDGRPAAVMMSPDHFATLSRRYTPEDILERARQTREMIAQAFAGRPIPDADELIDEGRDDVD